MSNHLQLTCVAASIAQLKTDCLCGVAGLSSKTLMTWTRAVIVWYDLTKIGVASVEVYHKGGEHWVYINQEPGWLPYTQVVKKNTDFVQVNCLGCSV